MSDLYPISIYVALNRTSLHYIFHLALSRRFNERDQSCLKTNLAFRTCCKTSNDPRLILFTSLPARLKPHIRGAAMTGQIHPISFLSLHEHGDRTWLHLIKGESRGVDR